MQIGSFTNPVKLVSESSPRSLLLKHAKHTSQGVFDFHKLPDFGHDAYTFNVLFNNHLTLQEVKLAIYLRDELNDGGRIFSTSSSNSFCPANKYGEGFRDDDGFKEGLVIGSNGSMSQNIIFTDDLGFFPSLLSLTQAMGMKLTPQGMTNLIRRLHDFGYITVTDITPENTFRPPVLSSTRHYRARLRHIRLCEGMCKKDITDRWISPMKRNHSKKKQHKTQASPGIENL